MANAHLPLKKVSFPIVAYLYHYEMKIISVILLQNQWKKSISNAY